MLKKISDNKILSIIVITVLVFSLLTLANYLYAKENPGGNDFLVHWMGAHNFFTTGTSPYSDDTALKVQTMVYGRAAQSGEHELRVAYPLYSIFLFAPFAAFSNFTLARALWMSVLELCLFGIVIFSLQLTYWKPKRWMVALLLVFAFISYHGMRPLINGNAVILVTFLFVIILKAIRDKNDELAGLLLAVTTIKPQNAILFLAFILIWALVNHRSRIVTWFLGTMVILVGFSFLIIPDWILQNLREVIRYPTYNPDGTVRAVLQTAWGAIGNRLGIALMILLAVVLLLEWWLVRHAEIRHFLWTAFLTIAISQWIGIQTDPGNFVLLYPGFFFCLYMIADRWGQKANVFFAAFLGAVTVGIWAIFLMTLEKSYQPIQSSIMFFPMPLICIILLYWIRWWVMNAGHLEMNRKHFDL